MEDGPIVSVLPSFLSRWTHLVGLAIHIHLIDFQVVSRSGGRNSVLPYEAAALKDVVLLGTNEKIHVLAKYQPWDGVYM